MEIKKLGLSSNQTKAIIWVERYGLNASHGLDVIHVQTFDHGHLFPVGSSALLLHLAIRSVRGTIIILLTLMILVSSFSILHSQFVHKQ